MLAKYHVEYAMNLGRNAHVLEHGYRLHAIRHEGVELSRAESDKLVKTAAGILAARHLCASLGIKPEEEHFRFGFTA